MEHHIFVVGQTDSCEGRNCDQATPAPSASTDRTISATVSVPANKLFSAALSEAMHFGHRITRVGWNARGQWVAVQRPDKGSKMSAPYLYLKNAQGDLVPWLPSQGDLFADDWAVLPA